MELRVGGAMGVSGGGGGGGGVVNVRGSPAFSDILPPGVLTSHSLAAPPVPGSGNARQTRSCPRGVCGGGAAVLQHRVGTITG